MLRSVAAADRARSCASNVPRYIEPSSARPVFGSSPISEARTVKRGCLGGASSHKAISSIIASESPLALLYNNASPLENLHAATLLRIATRHGLFAS